MSATVRLNHGTAWHGLAVESAHHVVTDCGRELPRAQVRKGRGEVGCVDCLRAEARELVESGEHTTLVDPFDLPVAEIDAAARSMALVAAAVEPRSATCAYCQAQTFDAAGEGWDHDEDGDPRCARCAAPERDEEQGEDDDDFDDSMDGDVESALASVYGPEDY